MRLADFSLLKKLMNMTLSGADQERLFAIDKANEIIKKSNTTWDKVLDRVISVEVPVESAESATGRSEEPTAVAARREAFRKRVEDAFATIEESDPRGDFADFVESIHEQWNTKGRLTDNQLEALFKSAKRAEERR